MTTPDAVLAYIRQERTATGVSPSIRQICAALGLSSTSVAAYAIRSLVAQGRLVRQGKGAAKSWVPANERRVYE